MKDIISFSVGAVMPLLLMMALGYGLNRIGLFPKSLCAGLNRLCFKVLLPIMLFYNIYSGSAFTAESLGAMLYAAVFAVAVFFLAVAGTKRMRPDRRGVFIMDVQRSNFAIIGLPLATYLYGEAGASVAAMMSMLTVPLFNVFAIVALTVYGPVRGKAPGPKEVWREISRNRLIWGVLAGVLTVGVRALLQRAGCSFRLTDVPGLMSAVKSASSAVTPMMLLCLGADFEFSFVRETMRPVMLCTFLRLIAVPAAGLGLAAVLFPSFTGAEYAALVAFFATPAAVMSAVMAGEMGSDHPFAEQVVVWSTALSMPSLILVIAVLRAAGIF